MIGLMIQGGRPVFETFSEFDDAPLGAASIGQVHRARLKSNGQVKIMNSVFKMTVFILKKCRFYNTNRRLQ